MHLAPHAQAVVLLTVAFDKSDRAGESPLSKGEWARFASWLKDHGREPAALIKGDLSPLLAGWIDRSVSLARLQALIGRGAALGFALEKWQRAGLWVLTRSDADYPDRLNRRLRADAPAVLFGCGNKSLLDRGGIAVVGSRKASEDDLGFTAKLGKDAAGQGYSIVSGGARGVDQSAMLGALDGKGTAVGVLSDSLLKSATSAGYRKHIMAGDLVLTSPFSPEAGFNVGNAMARNRYIYCLADAAVVVNSTLEKGGTWNGALENLKAAWVPLWVKRNGSARSGNPELARRGAQWLPDDLTSLAALANAPKPLAAPGSRPDLLLLRSDAKVASPPAPQSSIPEAKAPGGPSDRSEPLPKPVEVVSPHEAEPAAYALFLARLHEITTDSPMTAADIAERLALKKTQANAWLKRGAGEGKVRKLSKPVRYQSSNALPRQASLFDEGR